MKLQKTVLAAVFIFVLIHFLKDITQDILRISSPLDIFGDIQEDLSFLPKYLQNTFYYGLGGLSLIAEAFLLIAIPILILKKHSRKLAKLVLASIIYLLIFLLTCTLIDPRWRL